MDPNDTPQGAQPDNAAAEAAAAAAAGAATDGTTQEGGEVEKPAQSETDAFDRGVASVSEPGAAAGSEDAAAGDGGAAAASAEGEGAGGEAGKDGKPAGEGAAGAAAAKDGAKPDDGKPVTRSEQEKAIEKEISDLGIKNERTQARFRELATKAAEADTLRARATMADEWEETVTSTGASPEQFGKSMQYLADVCSGDPTRMGRAYDALVQELQDLGKLIGKAAPGVDVLDAHADLKAAVDAGDMTRAFAEELASRRATEALSRQASARRSEQTSQQTAVQRGTQAVAALGNELRAADPAGFQAKFAILAPVVDRIQKTLPPEEWVGAIRDAWAAMPAPQPAPRKPPISEQPLRPTGASAGQQRKPKTPEEAFEFGVATAKAAGL